MFAHKSTDMAYSEGSIVLHSIISYLDMFNHLWHLRQHSYYCRILAKWQYINIRTSSKKLSIEVAAIVYEFNVRSPVSKPSDLHTLQQTCKV